MKIKIEVSSSSGRQRLHFEKRCFNGRRYANDAWHDVTGDGQLCYFATVPWTAVIIIWEGRDPSLLYVGRCIMPSYFASMFDVKTTVRGEGTRNKPCIVTEAVYALTQEPSANGCGG